MVDSIKLVKSSEPDSTENVLDAKQLLSGDIIIGLIGYAGAGCTDVFKRLATFLNEHNFDMHQIKLSKYIADCSKNPISTEASDGSSKLESATKLQNLGDKIREEFGGEAVASLAIKKIKEIRTSQSEKRRALIVDSLKHPAEVELLRIVYESSFLLVGVYCGKDIRLDRLRDKFYGADIDDIKKFMARDERDPNSRLGQQVRKAFHQSDFFLDNSSTQSGHARDYDADLRRFVQIMEGGALIRPNIQETAMYSAYSASLRSSCLSRQVGAAIVDSKEQMVSTGSNEVPAFGGGVYHDSHKEEQNRCFKWSWWEKSDKKIPEGLAKPCCHNTRKKNDLKSNIADWMRDTLPIEIANQIYPETDEENLDLDSGDRGNLISSLEDFFRNIDQLKTSNNDLILDGIPGIGELIEYSRSIHAEMDAILGAARNRANIVGGTLYVTTYPCHNCARHIVSSGLVEVRFLEPYDKSLAIELHSDSIENEGSGESFVSIRPYTGIGPRVYEKYFLKRGEVKDPVSGVFTPPVGADLQVGVRLFELEKVEELAISKVPEDIAIDI